MSTAVATTTDQLPSKPNKPQRARIRGKLKLALDLMVFGKDGQRFDHVTAPREVNFNGGTMRKALERADVQRYLSEQRQVFRKSLSAANIHVLGEIRDGSKNAMARLKSVQILEQMDERAPASAGAQRNVSPGVVVIVNANRDAPLIDHQTLIEVNPLQSLSDVGHEE